MVHNVLRYLLVFALILGLLQTTPDNMFARYGIEGDILIKLALAVTLTALIAFQSVGFVIVMMLLVVGANLPADVAAEYNINRDYMLGTLVAVIAMPVVRQIIHL